MSELRVDHIAVAVHNLEDSLEFYTGSLKARCICVETVEEQGVRVAKLDMGNTHIELLEPLSEDSPVGRFMAKRGQGLHHICLGVPDIDRELACLKENGVRLIDETARIGAEGARIAFVHPASTGGVLMELSQPLEDH